MYKHIGIKFDSFSAYRNSSHLQFRIQLYFKYSMSFCNRNANQDLYSIAKFFPSTLKACIKFILTEPASMVGSTHPFHHTDTHTPHTAPASSAFVRSIQKRTFERYVTALRWFVSSYTRLHTPQTTWWPP